MDVHHHSHGEKKKAREYILEFFMLFLAVTLGFFAENIREHFTEHKREVAYIRSLIDDLKEDTSAVALYKGINLHMTRGQDSLIDILSTYKDTGTIDQKCYHFYFFYNTRFAEVIFNDRTISQLLNAGNMRLIEKQHMSDSIMDYNSVIKYVKAQGEAYSQYFLKTLDLSMEIFNFTYARMSMDDSFHLHSPLGGENSNFKLLTTDPALIKKYVNLLSLSKSILQGYILNLQLAGDRAALLIRQLKKAYRLNE